MAFAESALNVSQAELDDLTSALANTAAPDAFVNALPEGEAMVRDWTSRYIVPDAVLQRLWRPIVLFNLYTLAGTVSATRQKAYDNAIAELKDIRDGKFKQYPPADVAPAGDTANPAAYGSDTFVPTR